MSPTAPEFLSVGSVRFEDPALERCQRERGDFAAWQLALTRGVCEAAAAATGEFAVAIREAGGKTFLAVDRFATHPLCYRIDSAGLHYASRADALAGDGALIDPQAIFDYLYFHMIPSPRTIYQGVFRLPPAHCALYEDGRLTVQSYWAPTFDVEAQPPFEVRRDTFMSVLSHAVERALDGGKPACFLSGGTDSSTIAGLIGRVGGRPAATYSIGFDADGYDEMAYARIAARHFGTEHHEYYFTPDDLVQSIPAVARHFDQPFGNSSALPAYHCAKLAFEDGATRLLGGDGGDELFGGNTRYAKQRVFDWYQRAPAAVRLGILEPVLERSPLGRLPLLRKGASYVEQARVPMPDRLQMYNLLLRLGTADVLTPAFLASVDAQAPLRQQRVVWAGTNTVSQLNRTLAYDWRYTLAESDLPKVSMTAGLAGASVRFPFLDDEVRAFSQGLPDDAKLKGLKLRWFFKEALRGFLPDATIAKKKQGFGLPFGVWVGRHAGLRDLAFGSLESLASRDIVRPEFIRLLIVERLPEHPAYYGEMVWILMMLEQWLQGHAPSYGTTT